MPQEYFEFKQFRIDQDRCSMKVCTDSCVFGAWMAGKIAGKSQQKILDIGTGTGLLSLMVAQRNSCLIHAIDIDNNSLLQAKENFQSAPWSHQMQAFCSDVKSWSSNPKYDCIISNPPFYENDLLPAKKGKLDSRHSNSLSLSELIIATERLLTEHGFLGVLLPYSRAEYFEKEALKYSLFVNEKLYLRQSLKHNYFRAIFILEKKQKPVVQDEISIRDHTNEYTAEFVFLLKDYYLYL